MSNRTDSNQAARHPRTGAVAPRSTASPTPSGAQQALPFDDEAHEPIAYVLTAAAHREVATDGAPALQVVDEVDDRDTRPARARALRRGGVPITQIAARLGVDDLLVRAWIDDGASAPLLPHRRRVAEPAHAHPAAGTSSDARHGTGPRTRSDSRADEDTGGALARAAAAEEARTRLGSDPGFALGLGLLVGTVEPEQESRPRRRTAASTPAPADGPGGAGPTTCTLRLPTAQVAGRMMTWLVTYAGVGPGSVRMVLRLGSQAAGDLARRRWSAAVGIDHGRVCVVRTRQLVDPHGVQALLRVTDPDVCLRLAGWCDAVVWPDEDRVDLAF